MSIVWEINAVSLLAIATNTIWLTVFLVRASDRSIRAEKTADKAHDLAQENKEKLLQVTNVERAAEQASNCAHECKEKITIMNGMFAAYRESVAQNYVSREAMRDFEDRIEKSMDKLGLNIEKAITQRRPIQSHREE